MDEHSFTPDQEETLREIADHFRTGRKIAKALVHIVIFLGALAAAVGGYETFLKPHP
jgi:hypothetical protein